MNIRLQFASLITLGILSGFVLAIVLAASYYAGYVSWPLMIGLTLIFNFVMWLVGPYISDFMYKWFYKVEFYEYEQIKDKPFAQFVKRVCDEHGIKVPKIGIIKDQNPTAFTYGSAAFNARIVLTEGLFKFLDDREVEAVVAHELGHIINKDFIIMTIAATLLQILYQLYFVFTRSRSRGSDNKKGGYLVAIGIASLILYWVGTYVLLYLSRLREYYADEFAAKKTGDGNLLSSALIKIAYGIAAVPDTQKTAHLLNATRAQGIFDFKSANEFGLVHENSKNNRGLLEKALLFDLVNPWAKLLELKSTHPLVGKRVRRLSAMVQNPAFDFESLMDRSIDKGRLWGNFFKDVLVSYSILITIIVFIGLAVMQFMAGVNQFLPMLVAFFFAIIILSIVKVRYRLPMGNFAETTVIECMADIYASPVRGKPIRLSGQAIGRGQAGYVFGEDMMYQDRTGIIYLNYESGIPFLGNLFFAWKKLESLLMKPSSAEGWFLRGATHHIELHKFKVGEQIIKSYVRFWMVVGTILTILLIGVILFILAGIFL